MITRRTFLAALGPVIVATTASAQFTGPSVQGAQVTVAFAKDARVGTYHTLEGRIIAHLREDYYLFRDDTGEIRVEIPPSRFDGRKIAPENVVRIMGEVDRGAAGLRYIWVKRLDVVS